MEKFHKYCLSVLLVIICSNISAQISCGSVENEDCGILHEFYTTFLSTKNDNTVKSSTVQKESYEAIHQRQSAENVIKQAFPEKQIGKFCNGKSLLTNFGGKEHIEKLKNSQKTTRENSFAGTVCFKSKVSKIRNKDYLELIS
jgi:hypothetical protein